MLKDVNPEPEDNIINFKEKGHSYIVVISGDIIPAKLSVTGLISQMYSQENILDKVVSRNEEYEKFLNENSVSNIRTLINPTLTNPTFNISRRRNMPKFYSKSREEISKDFDESARLGTDLHKMIENFYNYGDIYEDVNFDNFIAFNSSLPDYIVPYRSEFNVSNSRVFDVNMGVVNVTPEFINIISGSIDMIYYNKNTGKYIICDWKRVDSVPTYGFGKYFYEPFDNLDTSKYNKYMLQLSIYKFLFEFGTNREVSNIWIITLLGETYNFHEMLPYSKTENILKFYNFI